MTFIYLLLVLKVHIVVIFAVAFCDSQFDFWILLIITTSNYNSTWYFRELDVTEANVTEFQLDGIFGWYHCDDINSEQFKNNDAGSPHAYIIKNFRDITNLEDLNTKVSGISGCFIAHMDVVAHCDYKFDYVENNSSIPVKQRNMIIGIVVGGIMFVIFILLISLWLRYKSE